MMTTKTTTTALATTKTMLATTRCEEDLLRLMRKIKEVSGCCVVFEQCFGLPTVIKFQILFWLLVMFVADKLFLFLHVNKES